MEDQLISFDTAKLAKEKGLTYDEVGQSYSYNGEFTYGRNDEHFYPAPTQSVLQKWLREEKNWFIGIELQLGKFAFHSYNIITPNKNWDDIIESGGNFIYDNYEDALEAGLISALNLL